MELTPQMRDALQKIDIEKTEREDVIISEYRKTNPYGDIPKELFKDLTEEMLERLRAILNE